MIPVVSVIRDEHRAMASVLEALLFVTEEIRAGRVARDTEPLWAMVRYIEAFPHGLHTPKEDRYLMPALRRRYPEAGPLIDDLGREHAHGDRLISALKAALADVETDHEGALERFATRAREFADFNWAHTNKEEGQLLPLAEQYLTPEDWQEIDVAWRSGEDPQIGSAVTREFRQLFRRIVNLTPAPMGLGPPVSR